MTPQDIAMIAAEAGHDAVWVFCRAIGDASIVPWANSPNWVKEASLVVVGAIMANPSISLSIEHQYKIWCDYQDTIGRPKQTPWHELVEQYRDRQRLFGTAVRGVFSHYAEVYGKWPQT